MKLTDTDIVYIVKRSEDNEELRYSLRSVAQNFPRRQIFIAGYKPSWVTNVRYIPMTQRSHNKHINALNNWTFAAQNKNVSESFIMFNDDFFVTEPIKELPVYHFGSYHKFENRYNTRHPASMYTSIIHHTRTILNELQVEKPISYELHVPMMMRKQHFLNILKLQAVFNPSRSPVNPRSLVGNFYRYGGEEIADVKMYRYDERFNHDSPFLSTTDDTFANGKVGEYIRAQFPEKCKYEK